jgi:hypothetical protein
MAETSSRIGRYIIGFFVVVALGFVAYTFITLHWSYSSGERAGYLQKLSEKGWVCKTWEGELTMVSLPGAAPEKFYFSVRDDATVAKINAAMGKRISLVYEQHRGVPSNCFGETEYFAVDVKEVAP